MEKIDNIWYNFDEYAVMRRGWFNENNLRYYLLHNGTMVTGFKTIDNSYYYFGESGDLKRNMWIPVGDKWYFSYDDTGKLTRNQWRNISNTWYYFGDNYQMKKGWFKYGNYWFYLAESGAMTTGWREIGNNTYYFNTNGEMQVGVHIIGGIEYEFNSSGVLIRKGPRRGFNPCNGQSCIVPYSTQNSENILESLGGH